MLLLPILLPSLLLLQSPSDIRLEGRQLDRFLQSRGRSHLGRSVRWSVGGKLFNGRPLRKARSHALFASRGIGILVRLSDPGLQEVLRRGGRAVLRGRVRRIPKAARRKKGPRYYLDVREVTRRKK